MSEISYSVPMVVRESAHGERGLDIFSSLLAERIIFVGDEITSDLANDVVAQLMILESDDPDKDISLYVNSPGGEPYDALAIYDTIQFIKPDVATICVGQAFGVAALLVAAGAKGKRSALANAKLLLHQHAGGFQGQGSDIEIQARETLALKRRVEELFARHSGNTVERVAKDSERDFYLSADEAEDYGLIDAVLKNRARTAAAA